MPESEPMKRPPVKHYLVETTGNRITAAFAWSFGFQFLIFSSLYIGFSTGTSGLIQNLARILVCVTSLVAIILTHCLIWSKRINNFGKGYCKTRCDFLLDIMSIQNLLGCFVHVFAGGLYFCVFLFIVVGRFDLLSSLCKDYVDSKCLVENNLYLIFCGAWVGLSLFLKDHFVTKLLLDFPIIQQRKYRQVMNELFPTFKLALLDAFVLSTSFIIVYFWLGGSVREMFAESTNLKFEGVPLTSVISLAKFSAFLQSLVLSSLYIFCIRSSEVLVKVFIMQHVTFPVVEALGVDDCVTLHQVLSEKEVHIMHHLGYLDLLILSGNDRRRRKELFSLSQPGGHPKHWNAVVAECLDLVCTFTANLNVAYNMCQKVPEDTTVLKERVYPVLSTKPETTPLSTMRNLAKDPKVDRTLAFKTSEIPQPKQANIYLFTPVMDGLSKLRAKLSKNCCVVYLFDELPEAYQQHILFSQGQLVIWTIESLSLLAAASFEEDSFGVVQRDLPSIIITLLQLKQVLEKLQKAGSYKKPQRNDKLDMKIKFAIRSAVKRSIYRITVKFGQNIKELFLPHETLQHLHNFLMLKEG